MQGVDSGIQPRFNPRTTAYTATCSVYDTDPVLGHLTLNVDWNNNNYEPGDPTLTCNNPDVTITTDMRDFGMFDINYGQLARDGVSPAYKLTASVPVYAKPEKGGEYHHTETYVITVKLQNMMSTRFANIVPESPYELTPSFDPTVSRYDLTDNVAKDGQTVTVKFTVTKDDPDQTVIASVNQGGSVSKTSESDTEVVYEVSMTKNSYPKQIFLITFGTSSLTRYSITAKLILSE